EPPAGKGIGRRHAKGLSLARTSDGAKRGGKRVETIANDRKQANAGLGQRERPRPATEQRSPAILLQQPDLMADRGWGNAEFGGGFLETEMPRGGFEGTQLDERRQPFHAATLDELHSSPTEFFGFAPLGPYMEQAIRPSKGARVLTAVRSVAAAAV